MVFMDPVVKPRYDIEGIF
ncbi:MAG TPA: palindromic element RPE4 domain-containing protein [Rickettsia endosymbiont of Ceroptres masudai]|nr:palindromic element RPE4 domain-containing protein [Rickettsia endosymbiont of Ceroptres masudai]